MMKKSLFIFFGLSLVVLLAPSFAQTNFTKTTELPPLRIPVSELQRALTRAHSLVSAANGSSAQVLQDEIEIDYRDLKINIPGHVIKIERAEIPNTFDYFEYTFSTRNPAAITSVHMRFGDFSRALSVSGNSPDQVDAVFSTLRGNFQDMSTPLGGSGLRIMLEAVLYTVLAMAATLLTIFYFESRRKFVLLPLALALILLVLLFELPLQDLLAGFLAVSGDASFIVRYGAQMSFAGFVIGGIALVVSLMPLFRERVSEPSSVSNPSQAGKTAQEHAQE